MEDGAYKMVYGDGNFFFKFFAFVLEIRSPEYHKIQEFDQNYHISAMKFSNFT
jgi:hypothetical protein